jgi:hypothetical protein
MLRAGERAPVKRSAARMKQRWVKTTSDGNEHVTDEASSPRRLPSSQALAQRPHLSLSLETELAIVERQRSSVDGRAGATVADDVVRSTATRAHRIFFIALSLWPGACSSGRCSE